MDSDHCEPFELDDPVLLDVSGLYARFLGMRMELLVRQTRGTRFVPARILAPDGDTASRHRFVLVRTNGWNGRRLHCVEVASGYVLASFAEGDGDGLRVRSEFDRRLSSVTSQSVDDDVDRAIGVSLIVEWPQPFADLDVFVLPRSADVPGLTPMTVWWSDQAVECRRSVTVVADREHDFHHAVLDTIGRSAGAVGPIQANGERSLHYAQIGRPWTDRREVADDPFQGADW